MDQKTGVDEKSVPSYLRGYKDPEKRKAYFRDRMREKYRAAQAAKGKVVKVHKSHEEITDEATTSAIEKTLAIAKDLTPDGDDDPILKAINRYGKYIPLIMQGLQGFKEAAQSYSQATGPAATPPQQGPRAPPGWLEFPPMEKIKRKYNPDGSLSNWYLAGEHYDREIELGPGVSSLPVAMERTYAGQANAARDRRSAAQAPADDNRSFRDLEREAANFGPKNAAEGDVPIVEAKPGAHMTAAQIAAMQRGEAAPQDDAEAVAEVTINAEEALKEVGAAMTEDVRRNLEIVIGYFKTRDLKSFEKDLSKAEEYAKNWGPILNATLGFHVKETIKRTTPEELLDLLARQDPKKAELIKRKKLEPKLRELWSGLQRELATDRKG